MCVKLRARLRAWPVWLALACAAIVAVGGQGEARAQEPIVFPILYGGTAYVDGAPAPAGLRLVARIGDREFATTVEANGFYRNLLVAPPTSAYYRRVITFHIDGMTAAEQDLFLPAGGPAFKDSGYDLHFTRPQQQTPTPAPSPPASPTATATATASPTPSPLPAAPTATAPPARAVDDGSGETGGLLLAAVLGGAAVVALAAGAFAYRRRRRR